MNPNDVIQLVNGDGTPREMTYEAFERLVNAKLRNTVSGEGSLTAKCVGRNEFVDEETGETRIICNFQAIAPDQVEELVEAFNNGDFQTALNLGLSQGFRENSRYIPENGEVVKLSIGHVENRAGKQVLRVVGCSPLPQATKKVNDLASILGARPSTPAVSSEPDLSEESIMGMDSASLLALASANQVDLSGFTNSQGKVAQAKLDAARKHVVAELV
jgi:hypothetical protein